MVWSFTSTWLKPGGRRGAPTLPANGDKLASELRETAHTWKVRLAETAAGQASPAARLAPALEQLDHDLSRKPRIVLLGEFNAGKTTLASLLARGAQLETDVLANTRVATLVHDAAHPPERILVPRRRQLTAEGGAVLATRAPFEYELLPSHAELLSRCTILDTPGLSDPTHAEQVADLYARIADIAVWCSIASHCWRESERHAWESFSGRLRRYGVLVLTGADAVPKSADRDRIRRRLERDAAGRFGVIVFLSAREAAAALDPGTGKIRDVARWEASGAAELERVLARLVAHVADQRALRSRRWAARLLRQMSTFPHVQFGPAWWLDPLMKMSEDVRRVAVAVRGHRVDRSEAFGQVEATVDNLCVELVGKLQRIGRADDARRVEQTVQRNLEGLRALRTQGGHAAAVDGIFKIGIRIFNDVSQLMRGTERETATLAELELRLLDMMGSNRRGKNPPGR